MRPCKVIVFFKRGILLFTILLFSGCTLFKKELDRKDASNGAPYLSFIYDGNEYIQNIESTAYYVINHMGASHYKDEEGDYFMLYAWVCPSNHNYDLDFLFFDVWLCFPWDEIVVGSTVSVSPEKCFFRVKTRDNIYKIDDKLYKAPDGRIAPVFYLSVHFSELSDSYAKCSFEAEVGVNALYGPETVKITDGVFQVLFSSDERNEVNGGFLAKEEYLKCLTMINSDEDNDS